MNKQHTYVILGAGQLGLAIMDELVDQKQTVKLVNRSGHINETLPKGVDLVAGDASDPAQVAAHCTGADVVFYCVQPPYHMWPALFPEMTKAAIEGIAQTGAKLVFGSNVYLYGDPDGQLIHEDLPASAQTNKGKARIEVANLLMEAHHSGKLDVVIGRASDFYGPRVTNSTFGSPLFEPAVAGKTANLLGDSSLPHTLTYIRDFAKALVTLSQHPEAFGKAWHVPSAPTISVDQFVDLIEDELDQEIKVRTSGKWMVRFLGLFNKTINEMVELMYEFDKPFVLDHSRFEKAFGAQVTPHSEAIKETVAWYKAAHI